MTLVANLFLECYVVVNVALLLELLDAANIELEPYWETDVHDCSINEAVSPAPTPVTNSTPQPDFDSSPGLISEIATEYNHRIIEGNANTETDDDCILLTEPPLRFRTLRSNPALEPDVDYNPNTISDRATRISYDAIDVDGLVGTDDDCILLTGPPPI